MQLKRKALSLLYAVKIPLRKAHTERLVQILFMRTLLKREHEIVSGYFYYRRI